MAEETLTFSELRKIQKSEKQQDNLVDLDDSFVLRVSDYLGRKKDMNGEDREYRNAKRIFEKIVSLREEKIVKNARLSVSSDIRSSELNLLPEEQELFREMRSVFKEHSEKMGGKIESDSPDQEKVNREPEPEPEPDKETGNEESEEEYVEIQVTSQVPEFMGTDLESYGPFEEGDTAEVPEENAEILINRGNAEEA